MSFIGRKRELALLEDAHKRSKGAFIPIYGRRRVGKSELILHFMKKRRGLYFVGKRAPAELQFREFLREAAVMVGDPLLAELGEVGWKRALEAMTERWQGPEKLIVALDEFQWMVEASPELPSVLQELWDRRWRDSGRIFLILCGSYVGFMEREVLGRKSPLFGRRTAQILLRPFDYQEAAAFHPRYSFFDRARAYFICGGVPLYLTAFDTSYSVEKNIEQNFLSEFATLFREPDFLLREELREVENYYAVLVAIAAGKATNAEIAKHTGLPERSLHYYIKQLSDLGYLARTHPVKPGRINQRAVRYALDDPLLRFWFRFVFPSMSHIIQVGPRAAFQDRIRPHLDSYLGSCFERMCREALPRLYLSEGLTADCEVGEYWDKKVQIDVVGLRSDNWVDLGECKWGPVRSSKRLEEEVASKVSRYPSSRATVGRRVFVRDKPPRLKPAEGTRWHSLEDLYNASPSSST